MSWDESLFKFALRAFDSALGLGPKAGSPDGAATLEALADRAHLLACAILGRGVEVREAEKFGGCSGSRLLLPGSIRVSTDDRELNTRAYLYRVLHSCMMAEAGLFLPPEHEGDTRLQEIAGILAAPFIAEQIEREFPAARELRLKLHQALLERLPLDLSVTELDIPENAALSVLLGGNPEVRHGTGPVNTSSLWASACEMAKHSKRPASRPIPAALRDVFLLWGLPVPRDARSAAGDLRKQEEIPTDSLSSGTERKAKPRESVNLIEMDENKHEENPLVHVFEKVQTAEEYKAGRKNKDGSDEMEEQQDALDDLDLREVIRSRDRAQSVYKADIRLDSGAPDLAGDPAEDAVGYRYDEWDCGKRKYKKDWCSVFSSVPGNPGWSPAHQDALQAVLRANVSQTELLRAKLSRMLTERAWAFRQIDGPEIDIDATVDHRADFRAGFTGNSRLYLHKNRHEKDCATLILLDASLSTDSWIANQRVLDVEKESMLVLAQVLDGIHDRVAVGSFHSNTRQDCRFHLMKGFGEDWSACRQRIMLMEPAGYTRIGPAIRHASALLEDVPARKKLLLLISDGKPTDYDRYEGSYGIEDVKQAVREASQISIKVRALAIDTEAKFYLPRMFGTGNYRILPNPKGLAEAMTRTFSEILA